MGFYRQKIAEFDGEHADMLAKLERYKVTFADQVDQLKITNSFREYIVVRLMQLHSATTVSATGLSGFYATFDVCLCGCVQSRQHSFLTEDAHFFFPFFSPFLSFPFLFLQHKLDWTVAQREEEINQLQKALSDMQVYLFQGQ